METTEDWKLKYEAMESKYSLLLRQYQELKSICDTALADKEHDRQEIDRLLEENEDLRNQISPPPSATKIHISDFAKTIFSRMPAMLNTISLFSHKTQNFETDVEVRASVHKMSGKPPQANPDQGVAFQCVDPGIYEAFFIVGVSKSSLGSLNKPNPKILFEYPEEGNSISTSAKRVIPEFCFPSPIEIKEISNRCSSSEMNEILYGPMPHRSKWTYIFTLRSEECLDEMNRLTIPNNTKEELYVLVERVNEIVISPDESTLWVVPKCYCIASYIPIFELHHEIISNLQVLKRLQRMEQFSMNGEFSPIEDVIEDQIKLLSSYQECDSIWPEMTIEIPIEKLAPVQYIVPEDMSLLDIAWLCIPFFHTFSLNELLWVIFALSQEKSIVFVSKNLGLLTSCVLGCLTLLRPLKWPNITVPIIPESLNELLDAPVPILAGIPEPPSERSMKTANVAWIMIDNEENGQKIQQLKKVDGIYEPQFTELRTLLAEPYSQFQSNQSLFKPTSQEKIAATQIFQIFSTFWNKIILGYSEGYSNKEWKRILGNKCSTNDIKYVESFTKTLMFMNSSQVNNIEDNID